MKRIVVIMSLIGLVLYACKKDEEEVVSKKGYTAKVDGEDWKAKTTTASIYNGTIVVIGEASDGTQIIFSLSGDSVGNYGIDENTSSSASFRLEDGKNFTSGGNSMAGGQILIEKISQTDKRITGNIEFTAVRASNDSTIVISNGRFVDIRYDQIPLGISDNSLKTKINASNWSPQVVSGFVAFSTLYLRAEDADGVRLLTFEIPELIGPGKYELNYFTDYKAVYTSISGKKYYAENGTLEVVSHNLVNREIEATFSMTAKDHEGGGSLKFTAGEFRIIYE